MSLRFCINCNNLLYAKEDRERRTLLFACRNCPHEESAVEARVYRNDLMRQSKEEAGVTQDLGKDPTLPRTQMQCPKCKANEVVFFQDQSKRTETRMTLFFVCTTCGHAFMDSSVTRK